MRNENVKDAYKTPVLKVWDIKCSCVICDSQTMSVSATEVHTADMSVFGGRDYDDFD